MITRIVRLSFKEECQGDFLTLFENTKQAIRGFDGCTHLELLKDADQPQVYYTFSKWQSAAHLEKYRSSELFAKTWKVTKTFFSDKASAWSMEQVTSA